MTLENQFPETAATEPAILAHHCTEAGLADRAVEYRLKAGQQAVARSAMVEAVAQLEKGLVLLTTLPTSLERQQQELDLRIALGRALIATRGYSSPEVGQIFSRASGIAEQIGRSDHVLPLLYGQWAYHLVRAEHRLALSFAERIEQVGGARNIPQHCYPVASTMGLFVFLLVSSLLHARCLSSAMSCVTLLYVRAYQRPRRRMHIPSCWDTWVAHWGFRLLRSSHVPGG